MAHFLWSRNCKGFDQPLRAGRQLFVEVDLVDSAVGVSAAGGQDVAAGGAHVNPSSVGVRRGLQPARLKVNLDAGAGGDSDGVRRGDSQGGPPPTRATLATT